MKEANEKIENLAEGHLVWLFIILAILGTVNYFTKTDPPKDIYIVAGNQFYSQEHHIFSGDTLKFLGISDKWLWVENRFGERCYYPKENSFRIVSNHTEKDLYEYELNSSRGFYYTTRSKVEKYCIGRTLKSIEKTWRPATRLYHSSTDASKWVAEFDKIAALDSDGYAYTVKAFFDEKGICRSVTFPRYAKEGRFRVFGIAPFAYNIIGWGWVMHNVQEALYPNMSRSFLILLPIALFLYFAWALLPMLIPALVVMSLVPLDIFRNLTRHQLLIITYLLTFLGAYIWWIALLCWGYSLFFLILGTAAILLLLFFSLYSSAEVVDQEKCFHCGRVNSYTLVKSEVTRKFKVDRVEHENIRKYDEIIPGSERTEWVPDTEYPDFSRMIYVHRKQTVYVRKDWLVHYNVTEYKQTYRCVCGQFRVKSGVKDYREIGRDLQGYSQENVPFKKDSVQWTDSRRKTNELSW